ncbi:MAG: glutamate-1-semialdehyde 2,1-aminomutase [Flavobacteriales bacterium]|jgi:glutamate-1-semialdehyde 2,1-aminomutase|nr:glutamate-1-semialdehyde 2,1-aminomutase [Flavobacteriales bacterium]
MGIDRSEQLFAKAKSLFPGGVNSPVRAFGSVGGTPRFISKGKGSKVWDADGNEYIDFCASWGPLILGHANEKVEEAIIGAVKDGTSFGAPTVQENALADLIISNHRFIERIRFVSSGTEAVMSAIRLARGFTGRNKVIKFEGCYHGHVDHMLVKAGSGLVTFGESSSAGIPKSFVDETVVIALNDEEAVKAAFEEFKDDVAAVIIEPIPANNGLLLQDGQFLRALREICSDENALLIFDEVISGFRVGFEGAAGLYDIKPDIFTFGKIIGGGMPVGAFAASEKIMSSIAPLGPVYQAGTLSGNPVAMAAGKAALEQLLEEGFYADMEARTKSLVDDVNGHIESNGLKVKMFSVGSIYWLAFSDRPSIRSAAEIEPKSMDVYRKFYHSLLENGFYIGPSGYEVGFVSAAHTKEELENAARIINLSLDKALS